MRSFVPYAKRDGFVDKANESTWEGARYSVSVKRTRPLADWMKDKALLPKKPPLKPVRDS